MFRAQSAHHQEVNDANPASDRLVQPLRKDFLSGCTRRPLAESDDTRSCICTIYVVDLLLVNGLRSKHVEKFNIMYFMWINKKFVYQVGNNRKLSITVIKEES